MNASSVLASWRSEFGFSVIKVPDEAIFWRFYEALDWMGTGDVAFT